MKIKSPFTEEQLTTMKGMSEYWGEILERDGLRRHESCRAGMETLRSRIEPAQLMYLVLAGYELLTLSKDIRSLDNASNDSADER